MIAGIQRLPQTRMTIGTSGTMALSGLGVKCAGGVSLLRSVPEFRQFAKDMGKPYLAAQKPENFAKAYSAFYDKVWSIGKSDEPEEEED